MIVEEPLLLVLVEEPGLLTDGGNMMPIPLRALTSRGEPSSSALSSSGPSTTGLTGDINLHKKAILIFIFLIMEH